MALILIADDLATARDVAARGLREQGHRVTTAGDGQEALLQFARERPDLAILDLFLPRVSGIDACARIKAGGAPFTPVIMTGISSEIGDRVAALAVAEDFLAKPYLVPELCARVQAHLRTRRLVVENGARSAPPVMAPPSGPPSGPPSRPRSQSVGPGARTSSAGSLLDRTGFLARLAEEWRRSARSTDPITVLVVGVDGPEGASAAPALSTALLRALRGIDLFCRADDRHIAGLFLNTHVTGMMSTVCRLRDELRGFALGGQPLSVSMGAAFHPSREVNQPSDLLELAERAIGRARETAPGRICFWQHSGYIFDPPDTL